MIDQPCNPNSAEMQNKRNQPDFPDSRKIKGRFNAALRLF